MLGESDAFDGEKLLGVDGLVGGGKILFQAGDRFQVFGANDGEVGSGKAVFAGVLGRAGLAFGKAWCRCGISKLQIIKESIASRAV